MELIFKVLLKKTLASYMRCNKQGVIKQLGADNLATRVRKKVNLENDANLVTTLNGFHQNVAVGAKMII